METKLDEIWIRNEVPGTCIGLALGRGCSAQNAPELDASLSEAFARAQQDPPEARVKAVRELLRHGKYKPTGRGKPASEYLSNAAKEARFPRINLLVDINNLVSLESNLPISLIDLARAGQGQADFGFSLRRGRPGESYVFNSAGQTIELEDLLLISKHPGDEPCANPVKDALSTKLSDEAQDVLAVIYAPVALISVVEAATARFGQALAEWAKARQTATAVILSGD